MIKRICYFLYLITRFYDNTFLIKIRKLLIENFLGSKSPGLIVRSNVHIYGYKKLSIGNDVSINHGCFLSCQGCLSIGDNVSIGHGTSILTTEHSYEDPQTPIKYQPIKLYSVKIYDNVWVGANVTILAGVAIAEGTIIAAGSVLTKDITAKNTIFAGVPAKFIKNRFNDK